MVDKGRFSDAKMINLDRGYMENNLLLDQIIVQTHSGRTTWFSGLEQKQ